MCTELKAASQLLCSLCKEEGGTGTYYSAYQLLSHIFLSHRFDIQILPATITHLPITIFLSHKFASQVIHTGENRINEWQKVLT